MKNAATLTISSHLVMVGRGGIRTTLESTRGEGYLMPGFHWRARVRDGAGGRNRTGTVLPPADFESAASTDFATPAGGGGVGAREGPDYGTRHAHRPPRRQSLHGLTQ